jgi:RNA polymerase primary sigma factor
MNELKTYFKDVGRHPVLKRPVLMELFKEFTEAENSALRQKLKQKIMLANLRLVVAEAKKWRRPHVTLDDIIQEGNIGLMRAIEKFDYTRGFAFSTYARWWIQQAMRRYVSSTTRVVRLPAHILAAMSKAHTICNNVSSMSQAGPSIEELGEKLGMSHNLARATMAATKGTVSLNGDIDYRSEGNAREVLQDRLPSTVPTPVEHILDGEMRDIIRGVISKLSSKEEKILRLRFGITDDPGDHTKHPITYGELEALKKRAKQENK